MVVDVHRQRAPYAADPRSSRGRAYPESPSPTRNAFRRDCDRVIHTTAFRRLKHKTQVFVFDEGDHYRTRLTHTLEVTQIARALARALGLDEDLAEALALAHDLGHPPFGHAGEQALDDCLKGYGGFDHNAQTLRIVTRMERRYPEFDGLNLTWETLEGIVKHNGPLTDLNGKPIGRYLERGLPVTLAEYAATNDLLLWTMPSAEAQVAAIADDVAYDAHDLEDGMRAHLFALEELEAVPLVADILADLRRDYPQLDTGRLSYGLIRALISRLIEDVTAETEQRLTRAAPSCVDEVRRAPGALVGFSVGAAAADREIKRFLSARMYRHPRTMQIMNAAQGVVRNLFGHFFAKPHDMPWEWANDLEPTDEPARARRVADFIAGMTDRYALAEHERHFDSKPEVF
jgi:dGTPase